MEEKYQQMAKVLKALSDPKRLRIAGMLSQQELGASRILESFSISQPTLSHDMHVLLDTGLVTEQRFGKNVIYRLERSEVNAFLEALEQLLCAGQEA
ncbi:MAG: helix-turn-helix transcriptional regulator [Clostridia bacterium]|nr:helix-turn-helix transcriptional regulator [Clostridia bacterium]